MSLYAIEKNVWQIEVIRGYDSNNKRIRYYERFKGGKKEAEARENEIKAEIKKGIFTPKTDLTFGNYLDKWMSEYAMPNLAPKTISSYKYMLRKINQDLGYYKLTDLNPMLLIQFYNGLRNKAKYEKECKYHKKSKEAEKLSNNTVLHYYALINSALEHALKWNLIFYNPNERVDRPKIVKKEARHYDQEQTQQLLKCLETENAKYRAIILLTLDTGARLGEITGLDWDNVNLNDPEKPYIIINKTTQYIDGKIIEKTPKNDTSIRRVYITKITSSALTEHKKEQEKIKEELGSKWGNSSKVFTTNGGLNMHPDTPRKILEKIIKKNNLTPINFHGLRHTSVSLLIASGIHTQVISKRVGHSSVSTTQNIYAHIFDSISSNVANTMNNILNTQ